MSGWMTLIISSLTITISRGGTLYLAAFLLSSTMRCFRNSNPRSKHLNSSGSSFSRSEHLFFDDNDFKGRHLVLGSFFVEFNDALFQKLESPLEALEFLR